MRARSYTLCALLIIAAGLAFRWPILNSGFAVDDFAQLSMMRGQFPVPRAALELFTFSDGTARENTALRAAGFLPWWSHPELRVSLMRPLSSALMWLDYSWFGGDARAYHLHSVCWWLAMLTLWAAVLWRLLPPWAALAALGLCAVHPVHGILLGWIANRNAVVASTFSLLSIWLVLRRTAGSQQRTRVPELLCFALALAASEYALGFLAYPPLIELAPNGGGRERLGRAAPWVLLFVAYAVLRSSLGFGTSHSGMYIDPVHEPAAFLRAAAVRFPVLVGELVLGVRSNWWTSGLPWAGAIGRLLGRPDIWALDLRGPRTLLEFAAWLGLLSGMAVLWRAQQESGTQLRAIAWAVPAALVPAVGAFPESRLLAPALLGWSVVITHCAFAAALRPAGHFMAGACALLIGFEALVPLSYSRAELLDSRHFATAARTAILSPQLDVALHAGQRALLLGAVDPTTTIYIPMLRKFYGRPAPDSSQLLMGGYSALRIERVDAKRFVLHRLQTAYTALDMYASAFNGQPLQAGQIFETRGLRARVEQVQDGRPIRVAYELDLPLDDSRIVLLLQTFSGLVRMEFPPVGTSIVAPAPAPPLGLIED